MSVRTFTVPGTPRPKGRPRLGRYGQVFTPRSTKTYEHKVSVYALKAGIRVEPGPFTVTIELWFPDHRRRDVDNAAKGVLDALNGIAWDDDVEVKKLVSVRHQVDANDPRAVITIESGTEKPTGSGSEDGW